MRNNMLYTFIFAMFVLAATSALGNPVTIGYYPSWKQNDMKNVDLGKYTHVVLSFAIPSEHGNLQFDNATLITQVVNEVHTKGGKALLSVGGWGGSNLFSPILKNQSARTNLLNSMISYVKTYNLDGIDIDWEYPGRLGNKCNKYDPNNDTNNFLGFLKDLRSRFNLEFGTHKRLITLAVGVKPFDGPKGPVSDVSGFAKVVDYANIMQYDINGAWNSVTGPNAPFSFEKGKGAQSSFASAIYDWISAGWPASQLTAGIGFYGRSTQALVDMTKDTANQYQRQSNTVPKGDADDTLWNDVCAGVTSNSGVWKWKNLRSENVLSTPSTATEPWVRYWDDVSKTPWLFNRNTKIFISYDDPKSIKAKVDYAASKGLAGAMVWSMEMDYNNELLDTILSWGNTTSVIY